MKHTQKRRLQIADCRLQISAVVAVSVLALVASCAPSAPSAANEPKPAIEPRPEAPKAVEGDAKWGTIKGRIVWGGDTIPAPAVLDTSKEAGCAADGPVHSEEWVINDKNKGVRYVFVWLRTEQEGGKLPIHPDLEKVKDEKVEFDQPCCKFVPHALALRKGQVLVAKNSSKFAHNFDWTGLIPTQGSNTLIPPGGKIEIEMKPSQYQITVKCGIHPWMKGWVRVFDHPYYAVTDADGNFEIKNAPAGKFRMVIWHETGWCQKSKKLGDPIEIKPGENDVGKIEIKANKE
jgi:hypothetical protein